MNDEIIEIRQIYVCLSGEGKQANAGANSYIKMWKDFILYDFKAFIAIFFLIRVRKRSPFDLFWFTDDFRCQASDTSWQETDFL